MQEELQKLTQPEIEKLWGDDLFGVFGDHIDEYGRLTSDWADILETEVPRLDKKYNDNPLHKATYGRMYMLEYEESADGKYIKPISNL